MRVSGCAPRPGDWQSAANARLRSAIDPGEVIDHPRAWVAAHPEIDLTPDQLNQAESMLSQYLDGEPLPYVLGHWEFFGLDLVVSPSGTHPTP